MLAYTCNRTRRNRNNKILLKSRVTGLKLHTVNYISNYSAVMMLVLIKFDSNMVAISIAVMH